MRKLLLAAVVAIAAFVVAPVTSASAETFAGACVIEGNATFGAGLAFEGAHLPVEGTAMLNYRFKSSKVVCVKNIPDGELTGIVKKLTECLSENLTVPQKAICTAELVELILKSGVGLAGSAEVKGEGELGCQQAAGGFKKTAPPGSPEFVKNSLEPGTGKLEAGPGESVKIKFRFLSTGTNVHFQAGQEAAADKDENYTADGEATFAEDTAGVAACASEEGPDKLKFQAVTAGVI